ncbi:restriction endonuclease subunit S [Aliivibrio fischeri]|uniref:restriction endonuclease subunit S n=1 Tax=Aliivibrio fischeri TaxID=668 RepID=UPI0012DA5B67|nr:restriction endonuclease subunit S [Aliivibrio fischeri]MUJ38035.1 restriction endonuclease subunit S [Aliivibrio fischeri]
MGSEWPNLTLGDVCYITDGAHSKVQRVEDGVMYLTSKNIGLGQLKLDNFDFITEESYEKLFTDTKISQRRLRTGDVLMGIIGTFGNCYVYKKADHFGISSSVAILRPNPDIVLPEYLYYVVSSNQFKAVVNKFKGGSVQGYTNIATLKALPITVPSLDVQKRIVAKLIPCDDKITLNRQINQTLEQMAQTLFKSWFVDFGPVIDNALDAIANGQNIEVPVSLAKRFEARKAVRESEGFEPLPADIRQLFPCEFEESELGFVPKGWAVSTTSEELVVKGGSTPSTKNLEFWENGDIHWTSPKDLSGNDTKIMLDTARKITSAGLKKITSGLLPVNTVLMSSRAPVGYLALAKVPVAINQGYIAIPSSKNLTSEYIIQWLDANMDEIKGVAGGTTFAEISKSTFKSLDIVIPNSEAVKAFTNIVNVNYERITDGVKQINALTKLRDTLLPKLISGELRLDSPQGEALQQAVSAE